MANPSPSKAKGTSAQLLRQSPRKSVQDQTAHVLARSPRINLQKQQGYEITPAAEDKLSPVTRNHTNSKDKEQQNETVSIRYAKATITELDTGFRARHTASVPQKVKNSKIESPFQENITKSKEIVVNDVEKIGSENTVESLVVNSPRKVMTNRKHEVLSRTLSPRKLNRKVLSEETSTKSPQKQVANTENVRCSPRKRVSEKLTGKDKIKSCEHIDKANLNKENICLNLNEQDVEEPVTKSDLIEANTKQCEDSPDNSVEHAGNGNANVGRSRKCKGLSISFGNRTEIPIESSGKLMDSEHMKTNIEPAKDLDSAKADVDNYELTKIGFYELVKCGKERTMVDRSSDDFEVCYARSFENVALPELKKDVNEDTGNITSDIRCKFGGSDAINESNGDISLTKHQKSFESKQHGVRSEKKCTPETNIDIGKNEKENVVNKNTKLGKQSAVNEDVFDIDMQSDITSDLHCLDSQATLHTFTKTLAERIKERSMGRKSLVETYNVNALYQLPSSSCSNSFISDISDRTAKTGQCPKSKINVQKLEKQKNGSSIIASSKVVNKYRNQRFGLKHGENNQIGYQGDDEHEKTPETLKLPYRQKRKKKTYWHYEAVVDNNEKLENNKLLHDLPNELRYLKEGNMRYSSDNSDTDSRRSIMRINKIEKLESKRTDNDHMECQKVVGNIGTQSTMLNQKEKSKKQRTKHYFVDDVSTKIVEENEKINASKKELKRSQESRKKNYFNKFVANEEIRQYENDTSLSRKLHKVKDSFTHVERQDRLRQLGKEKSEVYHGRVVSVKVNPDENDHNIINKNRKKQSSIERTERELNKEMKVKNVSGHANSNLKSIKLDKHVVSKQRTKVKYWHYIEEAIHDVNANRKKESNLPNELRNLKECWTDTEEMLDKRSRRKPRNVSEDAEVNISVTESDQVHEDLHENPNATSENRPSINVRSIKRIAKCDSVHQQEKKVEERRRCLKAASLYSFAGDTSDSKYDIDRLHKKHVHMVVKAGNMQRRFSRVNYKEIDIFGRESDEETHIYTANNIERTRTNNPDARYCQGSREPEMSSEKVERKPANIKGYINQKSKPMTDNESRKQTDEVGDNLKTQVSRQYCDHVLLSEEKLDEDSDKYLSKELRLVTGNNSDADYGRGGRTCKRQSKLMDNKCDTIEIEEESESNKTKNRDLNSITTYVKQGAETDFLKRKPKKYWDYVVEPVIDAGNRTDNSNLPKELRELKEPSFWNTGNELLNRRSRSKNRENITENRTANEKETEMCKGQQTKSVVSFKTSAEDDIEDRGRVNVKVIIENKEKRIMCQENKKDYIETSESDHSKSRKSHVYWDYEVVPVESSTLQIDKSLPRELQLLHSTWNDMSIAENSCTRSRCTDSRSRPEQSVKYSKQDSTDSIKYSNRSVHRRDNGVTALDSENKKCKPEQRTTELGFQDKLCPITNMERTVRKNDETVEKGAIKQTSVIRTEGVCRSLKSVYSKSGHIDPVDTLDENKEQLRRENYQQHPDNVSNKVNEERSVSPVFNIIQNSGHKVVRRCSPVFKRSPRPFKSRTSQEVENINHVSESTKIEVMTSKRHLRIEHSQGIPSDKLGSPIKCVVASLRFGKSSVEHIKDLDDYCADSEDEIHRHNSETLADANIGYTDYIVETPDKVVEVIERGSGYSNTPREIRRKRLKRRRQESTDNGVLCENGERKKRKLEYVNDAGPCSVVVDSNTIDKSSSGRLLKLNLEETGDTDGSLHTSCGAQQVTEHEDINEVCADRISLTWKHVSVNKDENSSEKVKVNKSWTMLSERSVSKLLSSDDDNEHFDGFTGDDKMPSDMSYEEQSEVEIPNDSEHEWVIEDKDDSSGDEDNLERLVPVYFPSPNKTSNSSWNDAVEHYIDHSMRQGHDSSMYFNVNSSLLKSPVKQLGASPVKVTSFQGVEAQLQSPVKMNRLCTPKKKRHKPIQSPEIEKVDAEIEFNFGSPQKNRCDFSPLRTINNVVKHLSSPVAFSLTSTPVGRKCKKQKQGK